MRLHRNLVFHSIPAALLAIGLAACGDDGPAGTESQTGTGTSDSTEGTSESDPGTTNPATDPTTTTDPTTSTDPTTAGPTTDDPTDTSTSSTGGVETSIMAGASWITILPEVDGSTAYFDRIANMPPLGLAPDDPGTDPGVFVEQWDVGTIAIGNGYPSSHWVHDEIRAGAFAIQDADDPLESIIVMTMADVYMLFEPDLRVVKDRVKEQLDDDALYSKLNFIFSATHNHMGPDTSGLDAINPEYYEYMADQFAAVIVSAVTNLQPATLTLSASNYQYGLADQNAPYLVDPTLHAMQAVSAENPDEVIGTVVQWQNHPEAVLDWGEDVHATEDQAAYLMSQDECFTVDDENCHIVGQYISAGFPGYMARHIMEETGAPALYFNGGVGAMMSPLRYPSWETEGDSGQPAGDGMEFPEGAVETGKSFHKVAVIGWELGKRVLADLEGGETITEAPLTFSETVFYSRLSNINFRAGLSVIDDEPVQLGWQKRMLYNCPAEGPKDDQTCTADDYGFTFDEILDFPVRDGDHLRAPIVHASIGPIEIITAPGEVVTELTHGLPSDFTEDPGEHYYGSEELKDENNVNHLPADEFSTPGYARHAMQGEYKWILGLTQDSGGYILAPANFRILCIADILGEDGSCAALYGLGIMDWESFDQSTYAVDGSRCKAITENPALLAMPPYSEVPGSAEAVAGSCMYGVAIGEFSSHYEETNSAGWDVGADWLTAVWAITGFDGDPVQVNPDFTGVNVAKL